MGKKVVIFLVKQIPMKCKTLILTMILFLCLHSCRQEESQKYISLINPDASEEAVNLFNFIQDIQGKYILSGQHNFVGKGSDYSDMLEEISGRKAIVWGSDFSFCVEGENAFRFQHCGPANLPAIPQERYRPGKDTVNEADSTSRGSNGNTNGSPFLFNGIAPSPLIFSVERIPTRGSG